MTTALKAVLAAALVACLGWPAGECLADDEPRAPNRTLDLFNGRDLEGWYPYLRDLGRSDPHGVFTVRNGLLRISGEVDGYLSTRTSWRDYRLLVEFRWGQSNRPDREGKARDAGLFLHSAGPDGNSFDARGAYKAALECQIMEGAVGDLLLIKGRNHNGDVIEPRLTTCVANVRDEEEWPFFLPCGRPLELRGWGRVNHFGKSRHWTDTFNFGRTNDETNPSDEWNRIECVCAEDSIRIFVNGRLVNSARNVFPNAGPILLQSEGSEIEFRTIQLHPLRSTDVQSAQNEAENRKLESRISRGALAPVSHVHFGRNRTLARSG
jgi:hypothetical protein